MTSTKAKLEFIHAMARHTKATVRQCEALMRYAGTLRAIAEQTTDSVSPGQNKLLDKRDRIRERVLDIIDQWNEGLDTPEYYANIQNQPTSAVLKIRVPDGFTNDMGREGICVPS